MVDSIAMQMQIKSVALFSTLYNIYIFWCFDCFNTYSYWHKLGVLPNFIADLRNYNGKNFSTFFGKIPVFSCIFLYVSYIFDKRILFFPIFFSIFENIGMTRLQISTKRRIQYLDCLIDPSLQGVNGLFVLSFENEEDRKVNTGYYILKVEIKDYNVMIDGKNFLDQPMKSDITTYDNILKIATGQGDDYTTGCLLDYNYVNNYYKMIEIDLSRQEALDADPKAIEKINFTWNLDQAESATITFIIEEAKKTILDFSQGTVRVIWMSSYDLTRLAHVAKVFDCTVCFTILFFSV